MQGCSRLQVIFSFTLELISSYLRVSPDQKREMVNMIKFGVPGVRTLSIGDGANDVAMIQVLRVYFSHYYFYIFNRKLMLESVFEEKKGFKL